MNLGGFSTFGQVMIRESDGMGVASNLIRSPATLSSGAFPGSITTAEEMTNMVYI